MWWKRNVFLGGGEKKRRRIKDALLILAALFFAAVVIVATKERFSRPPAVAVSPAIEPQPKMDVPQPAPPHAAQAPVQERQKAVQGGKTPPRRHAAAKATAKKNAKKKVRHAVRHAHAPPRSVRWTHWGAAPYARSLQEACRKAPRAIDHSRMPDAVKEHFKRVLGDCKSGRVVWLTPHERFAQMWSGPGKHRAKDFVMNDVTVAELPVKTGPDGRRYAPGAVAQTAKAYSWQWAYEGRVYTLYLPLACFNWSWSATNAPQRAQHVAPQSCFAYRLDGRGYPVKRPLQVVVDFYRHDRADLHRLMADPCFYAQDGKTGARLRLDRECATCMPGDRQAVWPRDVPVGAKTEYVFSVYSADGKTLGFPSGYGTVYVPKWFAASSLWCFTASDTYFGSAPAWWGSGTWRYESYYRSVTLREVTFDLARSTVFHAIIKPEGVLGR